LEGWLLWIYDAIYLAQNTTFVLESGKQLNHRQAFARAVFRKNTALCGDDTCVIEFSIQGGRLGSPSIVVSSVLPPPTSFSGWTLDDMSVLRPGLSL
jgi:hypothetical protein